MKISKTKHDPYTSQIYCQARPSCHLKFDLMMDGGLHSVGQNRVQIHLNQMNRSASYFRSNRTMALAGTKKRKVDIIKFYKSDFINRM